MEILMIGNTKTIIYKVSVAKQQHDADMAELVAINQSVWRREQSNKSLVTPPIEQRTKPTTEST